MALDRLAVFFVIGLLGFFVLQFFVREWWWRHRRRRFLRRLVRR